LAAHEKEKEPEGTSRVGLNPSLPAALRAGLGLVSAVG
jgi:hypothetical protein